MMGDATLVRENISFSYKGKNLMPVKIQSATFIQ